MPHIFGVGISYLLLGLFQHVVKLICAVLGVVIYYKLICHFHFCRFSQSITPLFAIYALSLRLHLTAVNHFVITLLSK